MVGATSKVIFSGVSAQTFVALLAGKKLVAVSATNFPGRMAMASQRRRLSKGWGFMKRIRGFTF